MKRLTTLLVLVFFAISLTGQIAPDKRKHFLCGALAGYTFTAFTCDKSDLESLAWAVGGTAAVGAGKELFDLCKGGPFDCADLAYTVAGGLTSHIVGRVIPYMIFDVNQSPHGNFYSVGYKRAIYKQGKPMKRKKKRI